MSESCFSSEAHFHTSGLRSSTGPNRYRERSPAYVLRFLPAKGFRYYAAFRLPRFHQPRLRSPLVTAYHDVASRFHSPSRPDAGAGWTWRRYGHGRLLGRPILIMERRGPPRLPGRPLITRQSQRRRRIPPCLTRPRKQRMWSSRPVNPWTSGIITFSALFTPGSRFRSAYVSTAPLPVRIPYSDGKAGYQSGGAAP